MLRLRAIFTARCPHVPRLRFRAGTELAEPAGQDHRAVRRRRRRRYARRRIIADHLSTAFREQFFIENRGGAGGIVGAQAGAAAEPDGYTLVVSSIASNVISPVFNPKAGYDGLRDFTHIAYLGGPPVVMIVHPRWRDDLQGLSRRRRAPPRSR